MSLQISEGFRKRILKRLIILPPSILPSYSLIDNFSLLRYYGSGSKLTSSRIIVSDYQTELEEKLDHIDKIFDIEKILIKKTNRNFINRYFEILKNPLIRIPIFGKRDPEDVHIDSVIDGTDFVEMYIRQENALRVLELGLGCDEHSLRLAMKHKKITFTCVDLDPDRVRYEMHKVRGLKNFRVEQGEFDELKGFHTDAVDIAFAIESLSFNQGQQGVIEETSRVLRPGGLFIVIDQYLGHSDGPLSKTELHARYLVGRKVALSDLETYDRFVERCSENGLLPEYEVDLSRAVLDGVLESNSLAEFTFGHPTFAKILSSISPVDFTYSLMSRYLLPTALRLKMVQFMVTVFRSR